MVVSLERVHVMASESPAARILVVEDDEQLAGHIKDYLEQHGEMKVLLEPRGDEALERIRDDGPDLVILDIMLPGMNGLEVCTRARQHYDGPILMLTALAEETDEVIGLELGADDYLSKPVSPRLLLARVKRLLSRLVDRRSAAIAPTPARPDAESQRLVLGALIIDNPNRTVALRGASLSLTTAEFDLLRMLAERAGRIVSRDALYKDLFGKEWDGLDRALDLRIARLRKKLGDDARQPQIIKSVRGLGYLLVSSV
jgi:two-component system, OmpR family, response regulator RstA